jgi:Flp pilus assembly protein TadB
MRKLLKMVLAVLLLQPIYANSYSPQIETNISEIADFPFHIKKEKSKKISLKQRLLLKFAERKLLKQTNVDKQKKTVKLLGNLSLLSAIIGVVLWALLFIVTWATAHVLAVIIVLLFPLALILGITSLLKRKQLTDKKGVSKMPALLGLIIGGAGVLLILIGIVSFLTSI